MGLLGYLFTQTAASPPCAASADTNDDGAVNVADSVFLLGYFFANRAAPAFPFPECGAVKDETGLSCEAFPPCAPRVIPTFQPYAGNPVLTSRAVKAKRLYRLSPQEYRIWFVENQETVVYPLDFDSDVLASGDGLSWDADDIRRNAISSVQSGLRFNYNVAEIRENGMYRAWHDATDNDCIAFTDLYYSTSEDGVNYTGHGLVLQRELPQEWRNIYQPTVVAALGAYHLYYTVNSGDEIVRIAYARGEPGNPWSPDGLSWTKYGVVVDLGREGSVNSGGACQAIVLFDGARFEMFYSGFNGTAWGPAFAISSDGLAWETLGPVDGVVGSVAGAVKEDGVYKVWSTSSPERGVFALNYAESVR